MKTVRLGGLLTVVLFVGCLGLFSDSASGQNRIQRENALPGAIDWQLTRVKIVGSGCRSVPVEAYCSRQSVLAGETIDIMASTSPARAFRLEIFRTGWYGGRGARLMQTIERVDCGTQPDPVPGEKNLHECRWKPSVSLTIPGDWLSGVYLGRLTTLPEGNEPYWQSYVIFIVKDERPADVLFQCSDNTWQAYNVWPTNYSVYTHPKGGQGPWADVSFDRPYGREAQFTSVVNDPLTVGSGEFLPYEFPMTYWLEQHGYDVSYVSNSDMLTPDRGLKCRAFISIGHDEYWDQRQFDSVSKMRDEGVDLLFLSGNSVCWVSPLRSGADGRANRIFFRGGPYGGENDYAVQR
ncbi:MAG: N,N-dimethylformamidase beta subunit family domain-containing protein, partial [Planctomycetaceae bacterium]